MGLDLGEHHLHLGRFDFAFLFGDHDVLLDIKEEEQDFGGHDDG